MKTVSDNQTVYWLLMQVMFQAKHVIGEIGDKYGLTLMQTNTLTMLKHDEPLPMNMLSTYFMCDASNVTGIVDRLETHGLIKRQDHPKDRRIKMIALTPNGEALRAKIFAETINAESTRLNPRLSPTEQASLHKLLNKIILPEAAKIPVKH